jgi:hypothetical protein
MTTATVPRPKSKTNKIASSNATMSADELNTAIDECGTVYIGVQFESEGETSFLRWKDRSFAIRRKIRALAKEAQKQRPEARFKARIQEGLEKTLIIGS